MRKEKTLSRSFGGGAIRRPTPKKTNFVMPTMSGSHTRTSIFRPAFPDGKPIVDGYTSSGENRMMWNHIRRVALTIKLHTREAVRLRPILLRDGSIGISIVSVTVLRSSSLIKRDQGNIVS